MTRGGLVVVVFIRHAEQRLAERGLDPTELAELVIEHHAQRRRNPRTADWIIQTRGIAVAYDWPDGDDEATAVVITAWRE